MTNHRQPPGNMDEYKPDNDATIRRLRNHLDELRSSVRDEPPSLDVLPTGESSGRPERGFRMFAAAAAVVLVAGGIVGVLAVRSTSSDSESPAASRPPPPETHPAQSAPDRTFTSGDEVEDTGYVVDALDIGFHEVAMFDDHADSFAGISWYGDNGYVIVHYKEGTGTAWLDELLEEMVANPYHETRADYPSDLDDPGRFTPYAVMKKAETASIADMQDELDSFSATDLGQLVSETGPLPEVNKMEVLLLDLVDPRDVADATRRYDHLIIGIEHGQTELPVRGG